jgi:DNA-binding transcriptional ArsR family regulator
LKVSSRDAVRVFKALSDVTRVEIVQLLWKAPRNVTELTSLVGVSQPKVSRHLKILRDAGLLRDVRKGKWVWYELAIPGKGEPTSVAVTALNSLFLGKELRSSRPQTLEALGRVSRVSASGGRASKVHARGADADEAVRRRAAPDFEGRRSVVQGMESSGRAARGGEVDRDAEVGAQARPAGESGAAHIVKGRAARKGRVPIEKERSNKRVAKESLRKKELEDFLL